MVAITKLIAAIAFVSTAAALPLEDNHVKFPTSKHGKPTPTKGHSRHKPTHTFTHKVGPHSKPSGKPSGWKPHHTWNQTSLIISSDTTVSTFIIPTEETSSPSYTTLTFSLTDVITDEATTTATPTEPAHTKTHATTSDHFVYSPSPKPGNGGGHH